MHASPALYEFAGQIHLLLTGVIAPEQTSKPEPGQGSVESKFGRLPSGQRSSPLDFIIGGVTTETGRVETLEII